MRLQIPNDVVRRYPDLRISYLVVRGMDNTGAVAEPLQAELKEAEATVRARFADIKQLQEDPRIDAWRQVYQGFGLNPNKVRPSAEALLRRVVKGGSLPLLSNAVDAYLLPQLTYLLPVGGYDLAMLSGDIQLRFSPGGEPFIGIGSTEPELTSANELVYADGARVLTRHWNLKDCDYAKITQASRDIALFVEGPLASVKTEDLTALAEQIAAKVRQYCGGTASTGLLDVRQAREVEL